MWLLFAILDALMAAISVILTKAGVKNVNPVLAFALESVLILIVSWSPVFFKGNQNEIGKIDKQTWLFLAGAGVATALSSLFKFRALKEGNAGAVTSIDRGSLVFVVMFATLFLKEKLTWQLIVGGILIIGGAVLIAAGQQEK
jgi:transporter family protein